MTSFEIERERIDLLDKISKSGNKTKVLLIHGFINLLLEQNDALILESYIYEFIDVYLSSIENYTPFFANPQNTEPILKQIQLLLKEKSLSEYRNRLEHLHESLLKELEKLYSVLEGNYMEKGQKNKIYFPLLEVSKEGYSWGALECINIVINRSDETKFIFVPSNGNIDDNLLEQAKTSFTLAKNYFKDYKKIREAKLEVLIYFENLDAQYAGNSLGMALTIGFIQRLSEMFNLPYLTMIESGVVITGGISIDQKPIKAENKIIKLKIETVFYSRAGSVIVSLENLTEAVNKLEELNSLYPNRKLKVIGISNLDEILNRRDLIILKKQSMLLRSARAAKKNWLATVSILSILAIIGTLIYVNIDNNPAIADLSGHTLYIKNKSGKTLWQKNMAEWVTRVDDLKKSVLIEDLNNDGKNEVLLTSELFNDNRDYFENYRIACFDRYGNIIWRYYFLDKVASRREDLSIYYGYSYIVGEVEVNGRKRIYFSARNANSYASAIYSLDAASGKRVGTTLWNAGYIGDAAIHDLDKDSKPEIIFTFANNGLKRTGIAVISTDEADGQAPTSDEYRLFDKKIAKFKAYILVPNTDYNKYVKAFQNGYSINTLIIKGNERTIHFNSVEGLGANVLSLTYMLGFDLKSIDLFAQSDFTAYRDALVREGKLKPPFTDTKQYYDILRSQVEFWNGNKFVTGKELLK